MWVSFWVVAAGWGMGKYAGQVTGALRPPEQITAEELRWDTQGSAGSRQDDSNGSKSAAGASFSGGRSSAGCS